MQHAPAVVDRPPFARWLFDHDVKIADAAAALEVSSEQVRRYTRPFGDPRRQIPTERVLGRIVALTQAAITAADFYPPHLRAKSPAGTGEDAQ